MNFCYHKQTNKPHAYLLTYLFIFDRFILFIFISRLSRSKIQMSRKHTHTQKKRYQPIDNGIEL